MKKIFLSFSLTVAFALFATFSRRNVGVNADQFLTPNVSIFDNTSQPLAQAPVPAPIPAPVPTPVPKTTIITPITAGGGTPPKAVAPKPAPIQTGQYKDGTYTGSVADAYYGYIQVEAVIQGGKLSDVIFLQYPSDRRTSVQINSQAMPYLKSEAIQAQSANVNIVSGASDSSRAFIESLGSALAVAKN